MEREDHEEGGGETIGKDTELPPSSSLEGLDFDRLKTESPQSLRFRLLTEKIGEFGPYQRRLYLLVCLPAALSASITMARSLFYHFSSFSSYHIPIAFLLPTLHYIAVLFHNVMVTPILLTGRSGLQVCDTYRI